MNGKLIAGLGLAAIGIVIGYFVPTPLKNVSSSWLPLILLVFVGAVAVLILLLWKLSKS